MEILWTQRYFRSYKSDVYKIDLQGLKLYTESIQSLYFKVYKTIRYYTISHQGTTFESSLGALSRPANESPAKRQEATISNWATFKTYCVHCQCAWHGCV